MDRTIALRMLAAGLCACVGTPYEGEPSAAPRRDEAPVATAPRPEFVRVSAQAQAVDALVREAHAAAGTQGRRLLVYVGATWCEPCQRFHEAVERGELDRELAGVRFLEFDADADGRSLDAAGYGGRLIPRFVVPDPSGRGTEAKIEGGPKGDAAVAQILARLQALLARTA